MGKDFKSKPLVKEIVMGYSTNFTGELKFTEELTGSELAALKGFLGQDRRSIGFNNDSIYEGGKYGSYWYHIDLEFLDDFSGIKWNECEKTYDLDCIINWLLDKSGVDFGLTGELLAQGESYDDRWRLAIVDGKAKRIDFPRIGDKITCPHCEEEFILEETK